MGKINRTIALILIGIIAISCLSLVSVKPVNAQTVLPTIEWSRTYPRTLNYTVGNYVPIARDYGCSVIHTSDGGYALVANLDDLIYPPHSGGVDNYTSVLIKTDSLGQIEWEKAYPQIMNYPKFVIQTGDNGFLLFGDLSTVIKLDSAGTVEWSKKYDLSVGSAIQASDGNYVMAGFMHPNAGSAIDAEIIKVDSQGNMLWNESCASDSGYAYAASILETASGDYMFVGQKDGAWLGVINSNGGLILDQNYNTSHVEGYFQAITSSGDGNYILVGGTFTGGYQNQGQGQMVKIDAAGNVIWQKIFDPPFSPIIPFAFSLNSVTKITANTIIAVGNNAQGSAVFMVDTFGNLMWNETSFDQHEQPALYAVVAESSNGGFTVVGTTKENVVSLVRFSSSQIIQTTPATSEDSPILNLTTVIVTVVAIAVVVFSVLLFNNHRKAAGLKQ